MKNKSFGAIPFSFLVALSLFLLSSAQEKKSESSTPGAQEASATSEKLPSAQEVVDRFVKEIGGKEAYAKLKSQYAKGTVEMPAQQIKGDIEAFAAEPNKLLMKIDMGAAGGVITTGFDGKVAWMVNAFTGPMLLEGKQKDQLAKQADFDHILHDAKDYKSMEVTGTTLFEGEDCYKMKLVDHFRNESTEYFSKKTGLQKGFTASQETPFGPITTTTHIAEYKKYNEVLFPAKLVQKMSGMEQIITLSEMEFNKVPAETFNLPPEVKALVK